MEPITVIVSAGVLAGIAYLFLPSLLSRLENRTDGILWILGMGLAARLALMIPEPFYEIDYYRYLWDGAVINAGSSPYAWSPEQVLSGAAPEELQKLAQEAPHIIGEINYPHLTTIYPPLAEAVFALSSWLRPWDLTIWRIMLLVFDGLTAVLLIALLRHLGRSSLWVAIYWLNPIVMVEFSNAAHMDVLLLPFLVAACHLSLRARASVAGGLCLAAATAVKLWPALLLPTLIRPVKRPAKALVIFACFMMVSAILLWPFLDQAFRADAGLHAFGVYWVRNAALFPALLAGIEAILDGFGFYNIDGGKLARFTVGLAIILLVLAVNRHAPVDAETTIRRILIIITALLLMGPAMFPWYYTWMVPFLAIVPSRALLTFAIVLPLYRLQFHPWFQEHPQFFWHGIVWLEQGPILILLYREWRADRWRLS